MSILKRNIVAGSASKEALVASVMTPTPTEVGAPMGNIGNVATVSSEPVMGDLLDSFGVTLENTSSNPQAFIIGDPTGQVATKLPGSYLNPTGSTNDGNVKGSGVLSQKAMFATQPIAIRGFNYQTSSSALQFGNRLMMASGNVDGSITIRPLNVQLYKRNNAFDDLLMTFSLRVPFVFNNRTALTLVVLPNETVQLDFEPYMVTA